MASEFTTPEEILSVDTAKLAAFIAKHSRNRLGWDKAEQLQATAQSSFGIDFALDAYQFRLRILLQQIRFSEEQLALLEKEITDRLERLDKHLVTIPGIGPVLAASTTGAKLVAYAGIDPTVRQSGEFTEKQNHISKRGSPYLRRAIWLAATVAKIHNPILKDFYSQKLSQGKHPLAATGAVARKLTYIIHAVLRDQKPYESLAWSFKSFACKGLFVTLKIANILFGFLNLRYLTFYSWF